MRLRLPERHGEARHPLRFAATIAAIGLVIVGGSAWLLASAVQSPEQRQADAAPPDPVAVFATVERGRLSDDVVLQGTVASADEQALTLPRDEDANLSVVTGAPVSVGTEKHSGELLTEVNGRPVFIAESPFDFYRDMGFGDVGPDVRQLQSALVSAGYLESTDGSFGPQTARAVAALYAEAGYAVPLRTRSGTEEEGAPKPIADPYIPAGEVAAVLRSPSVVLNGIDVGAKIGDAETVDLVLGSPSLLVRIDISGAPPEGVVEGAHAVIKVEGSELPGVLGEVSSSTLEGVEATTTTATFTVDRPSIRRASPATVAVTRSLVTEDALLLPVNAVVDRGDGRGIVVKQRRDGTLHEVAVNVMGSLRGIVAVQVTGAGDLNVGDRVRVG